MTLTRRELIQTKDASASARKMLSGSAAHCAQAENDHVEGHGEAEYRPAQRLGRVSASLIQRLAVEQPGDEVVHLDDVVWDTLRG